MRSTGEVMGLARDFGSAFYKAQRAAGNQLPQSGQVFISIRDHDKSQLGELGRDLVALGFTLLATDGTAAALTQAGLQVARVNKVYQGSPHIVDAMRSNEVALVINTVEGAKASHDSRSLRQTALRLKIPYTTTLSGAFALVKAMRARNSQANPSAVLALQDYIS
jgi:carbamoyl-phosphate synthase large subunit